MSTCLSSFKPGLVLNDTWVLGERLGEGACGQVFRVGLQAKDKKPEPLDLIIKCAYLPKGTSKKIKDQIKSANTIYKEYQMHKGPLLGFKYAPGLPSKHRPVGEDHSHTYFVMQRLDYTLEEMALAGTPTMQTISSLGLQILDGLRDMHRRGYVFVDVKPDNFMVLKDPKAPRSRSQVDFFANDRVFFVDFGLMEKLRAYNGGGQRENIARATLAGNACYCSLDVHECAVPAAKDDIEALGYMLLSLLNDAQLPWSAGKSEVDCLRLKKETDIEELATKLGCPLMAEYIELARAVGYGDTPDYNAFQAILEALPSAISGRGRNSKSSYSKKPARSSVAAIEEHTSAGAEAKTSNKKTKSAGKTAAAASKGDNDDEESLEEIRAAKTATRPSRARKTPCPPNPRISPRTRSTRGNKQTTAVADIISISSNDCDDIEEEEEQGGTPVRTKKVSASRICSPPQRAVSSNESSRGKRSRHEGSSSNSTRRSKSSSSDIHSLLEDSEEDSDEEGRGNTPVKVKKAKNPSPLNDLLLLPPPLSKRPTKEIPADELTDIAARPRKRAAKSPFLQVQREEEFAPQSSAPHTQEKENFANAASASQLCLQVVACAYKPYVGQVWPLGGTSTDDFCLSTHMVGSFEGDEDDEERCDIVLMEDEYMSARHAKLQVKEKVRTRRSNGEDMGAELSLRVMDLHSTNSSRINGKRIKPNRWAQAEVGDEIQLGETKFTLRVIR